jgi:hypothetical protein
LGSVFILCFYDVVIVADVDSDFSARMVSVDHINKGAKLVIGAVEDERCAV